MKRITILLAFLILLLTIYGFFQESDKKKGLPKITTNDDIEYIAINECFMWIGNNGMGSHNPISDDSGFYWPGGEDAKIGAIFSDGLIWGAKVDDAIRVNGSTYRYGLQAGKILKNGEADNPSDQKYRIFKIRKNWEDLPEGNRKNEYRKDYEEWPVEDGAPWIDKNGDGIYSKGIDEPEILGDEMLWCVSNDLDTERTKYTYGSTPIGLEVQSTVFGFDHAGDLGDMIFKKYKIINKSKKLLTDMYIGYWNDVDLGFAGDDFVGCDTTLNLGYTYNSDNLDEDFYGDNPPAIGYVLLQTKVNNTNTNNFSSFLNMLKNIYGFYLEDPKMADYSGSIEFYNLLQGLDLLGDSLVNPVSNKVTKYMVSGDPVTGIGWYEGEGWEGGPSAADRRSLLSSGPFNLEPNDVCEIIMGIIIGRGSDNIQSIVELKKKTEKAITMYQDDFTFVPSIPSPVFNYSIDDTMITFYWNSELEDFDIVDKLITGNGYPDESYTFEGYLLRQYTDMQGTEGKIIASFDLRNNVNKLIENKREFGFSYQNLIVVLENNGIQRRITISRDSLSATELKNNHPYYFSLSAFAVSEFSDPMFIESERNIIEFFPGSNPTNYDDKGYRTGDYLSPELKEGFTNADIKFYIVDPLKLSGDSYNVTFNMNENDRISYNLKNMTSNILLIENGTNFIYQSVNEFGVPYFENANNQLVIDGFTLNIRDLGAEKIWNLGTKYAVMDVLEVKGPGGKELEKPISVDGLDNLNSTGQWSIFPKGLSDRYNWQNRKSQEGLGYDFYEIRFTSTGSDIFVSGTNFGSLSTVVTKDDPRGIGKVPFEIWNIKQTLDDISDDERLIIKILDYNRANPDSTIQDNKWSQLLSGNWEEIYAYQDSVMDPDNLPEQSGTSDFTDHKFGALVISGSQPAEGTVIRLVPAFPLVEENVFEITMPKADLNSKEKAKDQMDKINVFPNPYYVTHSLEVSNYNRYVRFINLPEKATIRIFNLGGTFIQKIEKDNRYDFIDWDLRNHHNVFIASGLYIAYIELPEIGNKILKIAVILGGN